MKYGTPDRSLLEYTLCFYLLESHFVKYFSLSTFSLAEVAGSLRDYETHWY